jgi:DNA-binding transcriptional MerR regulator
LCIDPALGIIAATMTERTRDSAPARDDADRDYADIRGIQEIATELGVTQRTLRFYEDQGLIEPVRVGNTRIYTRRDIARMRLILRGKRLGFSIREIKEFLDLYDADPQHVEQMRMLAARVRARIVDLEQQRIALEETVEELKQMERDALARVGTTPEDTGGSA